MKILLKILRSDTIHVLVWFALAGNMIASLVGENLHSMVGWLLAMAFFVIAAVWIKETGGKCQQENTLRETQSKKKGKSK